MAPPGVSPRPGRSALPGRFPARRIAVVPKLPTEIVEAFERYLMGPTLVNEALREIDPSRLNRPNDEGWSIRDIVVHLADTEMMRAVRFGLILADDEPTLPVLNEQQWKRKLHYLWRSPEAALSLFTQTRFAMGEMLRQCDAPAWQRGGMHPELGRLTVADLVRRGVEHVDAHVTQIGELRAR